MSDAALSVESSSPSPALGAVREQRRLLSIIEATPCLVGIADERGRVLYLNAAGRAMLDLDDAEDPTRRGVAEFYPPRAYRRLRGEAFPAALRTGEWSGETELRTAKGETIAVWQVVIAHDTSEGEETYFSTIAQDLTSWRRTEDELVERVKELRTLYAVSRELSRSAAPLSRRLERVAELLPRACLHPDEAEARIVWGEQAFSTQGFRDTHRKISSDIRSQSQVVGRVELALREDVPERERGEGPFSSEGRDLIDAVATTLSEAVERDRLQAEYIQGQKLETIGQLAGGVAHDFNNLLMVIQGHAEMALESLPPGALVRHDLQQILDAGRRGGNLTRQLLAFSRRQALQERFLRMADALRAIEPILRSLVPERIDLTVSVAEGPGPVRVDPVKLDQIILNLAANAADAITARGSIALELDERTIDGHEADAIPWRVEPGRYVRLSVRDTGTGMSPEVLDRIFEPFFTTRPEGRGTGLGLSVVFGIVKQSGGHLFVESAPGEGTAVQVLLPHVDADDASASPPEPERAGRSGPHDPPAPDIEPGRRMILLAEDDRSVREILTRILARAGHRVLLAGNGREALETVESYGPQIDLVMSDVVMPEMGGSEFLEELRRIRPDLRVILMSGYSQKELTDGIREKAAAFLEKPFAPSDVSRVIREALDAPTTQPASSDPFEPSPSTHGGSA